jgi:hypothetical protein
MTNTRVEGFEGGIDESAIAMPLGCKTIWHQQMSLIPVEGTPNILSSLGAGPPGGVIHSGVAAAEQTGLAMDTADEVYGEVDLAELFMLNRGHDLQLQVGFAVQEASKSAIDWAAWVKFIRPTKDGTAGEAESDCKVSSDGNVAFAAAANTLAGEYVLTEKKALALGTYTTDDILAFCVELDDKGDATADQVFLKFLRIWYTLTVTGTTGHREVT